MSVYIDTSCLLKLFLPEAESAEVATFVAKQRRVLVSPLARLEVAVRLQRLRAERAIDARIFRQLTQQVDRVLTQAPFELAAFDVDPFSIAHAQIQRARSIYCKTLDRLHLATMTALGARTLLTNDAQQARAARANGLKVRMLRAHRGT